MCLDTIQQLNNSTTQQINTLITMKKVTLILSAFALVLGLSQCKKQEEPVQNGEKQHIVLTANNGNDGSKVAASFASAALNLTWEGNETIAVSGGASGTLTYKSGVGTGQATFVGDITKGSDDVVFTIGGAPSSYEGQVGTADDCAAWIKENNHFVGTSQWQDDGNYNVTMELQYAVLKLDVSALGTTGAMTIAANGATVASVTDVASSEGKAVFVAVPTDETEKAYTITCGGKTATKTWKLEKNVFYTKAGAEGAGTGDAIVIDTPKFSVSSTTKVEFALGNLYWDGSAFRFEANQWDYRHYSGKNNDAAVIGGVSQTTPSGTVGSFFWSKTASVAYAASYSESGTTTSDVFFTNGQSFQVAGETAGTWRTLSQAEWAYLLNDRTSASSLRAWVTLTDVNVNGLVILPDGTDASVMESISSTSDLAKYNAVFLPAAGCRGGTGVIAVGSGGYYWSGTPNEDDEGSVYSMYFGSGNVSVINDNRYYGDAVRLVR